MTTFTVTIGWTLGHEDSDYSQFIDGYVPGVPQHEETIEVEWTNPPFVDESAVLAFEKTLAEAEDMLAGRIAETLAEAVFTATNDPFPRSLQGLPRQIVDLIDETGWTGRVDDDDVYGHYSLSKGDTVTVGDVKLACDSFGWKRV